MPAASASAASTMAVATVAAAAAAGTRDATHFESLLYGFYIYCKSFFVIFKKTILTSTLSRLSLCMETTTTSSNRRGSRLDIEPPTTTEGQKKTDNDNWLKVFTLPL
jgi:hypothetical protein